MQRSPCQDCSVHQAGHDKNGHECLSCDKRVAYVVALEGRSGPVPMEMTDMAARRFTEEDDRLIPTADLSSKQIAEKLGRTVGAIYVRRSLLGGQQPNVKKMKYAPDTATLPGEDLPDTTINLEDHPDVLNQLRKRADDELRTVKNQALWFIKCALQRGAPDNRRAPDRAS